MMFHGVNGGANGGESHLTYLTQESAKSNDGKEVDVAVDDCGDYCFNGRVDDSVDVAVEDGVNSSESHLTHLTLKVDCCLMERKKHTVYGECQYHEVLNVTKSKSWLYDSAK
eukprot:13695272-Ditylum_brightwellii.AAC.1